MLDILTAVKKKKKFTLIMTAWGNKTGSFKTSIN